MSMRLLASQALSVCSLFRYGNMKTAVMALTAVMPDGRIIKTGSKCGFPGARSLLPTLQMTDAVLSG